MNEVNEVKEDNIKGILMFYIDVGQMPPFKAEAYMLRVKNSLNEDGTLDMLKEQGYRCLCMPVRPGNTTRMEIIPLEKGAFPVSTVTIDHDDRSSIQKLKDAKIQFIAQNPLMASLGNVAEQDLSSYVAPHLTSQYT